MILSRPIQHILSIFSLAWLMGCHSERQSAKTESQAAAEDKKAFGRVQETPHDGVHLLGIKGKEKGHITYLIAPMWSGRKMPADLAREKGVKAKNLDELALELTVLREGTNVLVNMVDAFDDPRQELVPVSEVDIQAVEKIIDHKRLKIRLVQ